MLKPGAVVQGLSQETMKLIEAGTVALSFWSPPYFVGKQYEKDETFDTWQEMLRLVIRNHFEVLRPGGFMVINIADILCFEDGSIPRFQAMNSSLHKVDVTRDMVLAAKSSNPSANRRQLAALLSCSEQTVDRRLNGNNIRGGKYTTQTRVKLVGGSLEAFAYEAGLFLYDKRVWVKDPSWANSRWTNSSLKAVSEYEDLYVFWKPGPQVINRERLSPDEWREWGSRGVWYLDSVRRNDDHEAKFPIRLAERVLRLYTDPGDVVLDPFMGSGTTALAALKTGRKFIGIEKEAKYVELAREKIELMQRQSTLDLDS